MRLGAPVREIISLAFPKHLNAWEECVMRSALAGVAVFLCGLILGFVGHADASEPGDKKPSLYESPLGFTFEIPPGWATREWESGVYLVETEWKELGFPSFLVQTCPKAMPDSCLEYPEYPDQLVGTKEVTIAGLPAKEYTFHRRNKPKEWTREWTEVHTIVTTQGKVFDVVAMVPPTRPNPDQIWRLYDRIRQTFRLVNPKRFGPSSS